MKMKNLKNSQVYYEMAHDSLKNVNFDEIGLDKKVLIAKHKSIAILVDHIFLPVPLTVVSLDLCIDNMRVAKYYVYIDEKNKVIDDVLEI
jgi:hypothetical protein